MVAFSTSIEAPLLDTIPNQSPLAGLPEPVAPPTLLSLNEVKVMGLVEVPTALRVPSTVDAAGGFETVSGAMLRVTPECDRERADPPRVGGRHGLSGGHRPAHPEDLRRSWAGHSVGDQPSEVEVRGADKVRRFASHGQRCGVPGDDGTRGRTHREPSGRETGGGRCLGQGVAFHRHRLVVNEDRIAVEALIVELWTTVDPVPAESRMTRLRAWLISIVLDGDR